LEPARANLLFDAALGYAPEVGANRIRTSAYENRCVPGGGAHEETLEQTTEPSP